MKVFWTNFAKGKLKEIFSYYKKKVNVEFSETLTSAIIDRSAKLSLQPTQGPIEELLKHRQEKFRFVLYKNYKIVYWINRSKNRIEVVHVFDSRQNPDKLKGLK